jgi:hypothetical protein
LEDGRQVVRGRRWNKRLTRLHVWGADTKPLKGSFVDYIPSGRGLHHAPRSVTGAFESTPPARLLTLRYHCGKHSMNDWSVEGTGGMCAHTLRGGCV